MYSDQEIKSWLWQMGFLAMALATWPGQIGMEVEVVGFGYDDVPDLQQVREAAQRFRPRLVTAVHCETPSGTLTSLEEIGAICREVDALFYVDFVSSGGGVAGASGRLAY